MARGRCKVCRKSASQIHHSVYTYDNLSGRSLTGLHALCAGCHKEVELDTAGNKRTFGEAAAVFKALLKHPRPKKKAGKGGSPGVGLAFKRFHQARKRGRR